MCLSQNPNVHAPVWIGQHLVISQIRHILLCLCAGTSAQSATLHWPILLLPQDLLGLSTGQPFFSTTVSAHRFFSTPSVFRDARNWHVSSSLCSVVPPWPLSPGNLHMAEPLLLYWQDKVTCKHAEFDIHSATESYGTLGK